MYDIEFAIEMLQSNVDIVNFAPMMLAITLDVDNREAVSHLQFGGILLAEINTRGSRSGQSEHSHRLHWDQINGDGLTMRKVTGNFHYPGTS